MIMGISQLLATGTSKSDAQSRRGTDTEAADGEVSPSASLDEVFDILSSSRRRHVLRRLAEGDGPSSIGELAEHVASIENGKPVSALTSQERKRVYVSLYQAHLPRMADSEVIELDDRGTVTLGSNADAVHDYLTEFSSADTDAPTPYAIHTGGSAAALAVGVVWLESLLPLFFALSLCGYALLVARQFLRGEAR